MNYDYKLHRRPDGKVEVHTPQGHRIDNVRGKTFAVDETSRFTFTTSQVTRMMRRFANGNKREVKLRLLSGEIRTFSPKIKKSRAHPDMYKRTT